MDYEKKYKEYLERAREINRGWLEKQGKQNPYSGVSFEYNGHTWGMCARDNGVEILVDGEIKERIFLDNEPQGKTTLEAQQEEKIDITNKVEPKFHEGDFIINNEGNAYKVIGVCDDNGIEYSLRRLRDNGSLRAIISTVDRKCHLWTINDAKEGDILASDDGVIILVKESRDSLWGYRLSYHCAVLHDGTFEPREFHVDPEEFFPATKEQRETLMKAMTDAGYTFDFEKKELKKIEYEPENYKQQVMSEITNLVKDYIIQKPVAWSEDDKAMLDKVIERLHKHSPGGEEYADIYYWLIALKDRVQPKVEWSDTDEYMLYETIQHLKLLIAIDKVKHFGCDVQYYQRDIDWLESLKGRCNWKPSNEQIKALEHFVRSIGESGYASPYNNNTKLLYSLLEQLKKLIK